MADKKTGVVGRTLRKPLNLCLILMLMLFIAGYSGNFYFGQLQARSGEAYIRNINELKISSQEIAKNGAAAAASDGQKAIFEVLSGNKSNFSTHLGYLTGGNPAQVIPVASAAAQTELVKIAALWKDTKNQIDTIMDNRATLVFLNGIHDDMDITMSAIQQQNSKIVVSMLRLNLPANQVALAQRQNLLVERMTRSIDKIIELGSSNSLLDNFNRDSSNFRQVLRGLTEGDRKLLLSAVRNAEVQASLTRINELFRTVSSRMDEISTRSQNVVDSKRAAVALRLGSGEYVDLSNRLLDIYNGSILLRPGSPFIGVAFAAGALLIIFLLSFFVYYGVRRTAAENEGQNELNQEAILQLLDEMADLADGDLRVQATVTESFTGAIADSINFSIDHLRSLVSKINQAASMVSTATEQTRTSLGQLSNASKRQAAEIADVSEAVNEMAVSIDKVSFNAAESSSVAERSVNIANKGASVVQNTIGGMENIRGQIQETAKRIKRLGESSQEIGDIVSLINDIADQTNILSLNAAIQASMAGDAGKGFAVVADEVQRLAERSGAAAKQISALVKTIQSDTNEAVMSMEQTTAEVVQGTRLAQDAGVALGEIDSVSKSLAEIIENISDAAREQAVSAGKISKTMKSIEEITSQTNEGTQATVVAVGNLADITNELRSSVTGFKLPE
ncbi:MAG: methyl-accepting chemotaxis protein [bacterium]|nr:methyl-accepting chemotaxis protein [Gammaproteobacteria bacterium]HIL99065.1 methyl-accepting chemotaxis protein [Pseudomonadales bacterium]